MSALTLVKSPRSSVLSLVKRPQVAEFADTFPFVSLDRVPAHIGSMAAVAAGIRRNSPAAHRSIHYSASMRIWGSPTAQTESPRLIARGRTADGLGLVVTVDLTDDRPEDLGPRSMVL
jgi:hypothetical protein